MDFEIQRATCLGTIEKSVIEREFCFESICQSIPELQGIKVQR